MKLSKKVLVSSLIATTLLISACDKKADNSQTSQAPAATQAPTQPAATVPANDMLAAFNQSVRVQFTSRNFVENEQKNQGIAFSYQISNLSNKTISSMNWIFAYRFNNEIIYANPFGLNFEQGLTANNHFNLNFVIPFDKLSEQSRAIFADPKNEIESIVVAREITFADGSKIIVEN